MENNIKVEQWLGNEIRFVEVNNEWWAVAGDVAKALGYRDAPTMTRNIDDEDRINVKTPSLYKEGKARNTQTYVAISMKGLKTYLVNCRNKKAKDLLNELGEEINIYMYKKQPKQVEFEFLLLEQVQRFYELGGIPYKDWNFLVDNSTLIKDALDFKTEYKIPGTNYKVDFYLKGFDIIIEYDEKHHLRQLEKDTRREAEITNAMVDYAGVEPIFIRVSEGEEYQGVIDLFGMMFKRSI